MVRGQKLPVCSARVSGRQSSSTPESTAWKLRGQILNAFANMDRELITELALLRRIFEPRGCPMVAGGDPWEAESVFAKVFIFIEHFGRRSGGPRNDWSAREGYINLLPGASPS